MILNIDLNPGLRRDIYIEKLEEKSLNKIESSKISLEGNGAVMEHFFNILKEESILTGLIGSRHKDLYYELLPKNNHDFIELKDTTFERTNIIDKDFNITSLERELKITKEEITDFVNKYHDSLENIKVLGLFNNLNDSITKGFYKSLIRIASIKNKSSVLEVTTKDMIDIMKEGPNLVITNERVLSEISNVKMLTFKEIPKLSNYILRLGVNMVLVNLYERGLFLVTEEKSYYMDGLKQEFLTRDNYGLMAGLLVSLNRNYDLETFLRLTQACNIAYNTNYDYYNIEFGDIKKYMNEIEVKELDKEWDYGYYG